MPPRSPGRVRVPRPLQAIAGGRLPPGRGAEEPRGPRHSPPAARPAGAPAGVQGGRNAGAGRETSPQRAVSPLRRAPAAAPSPERFPVSAAGYRPAGEELKIRLYPLAFGNPAPGGKRVLDPRLSPARRDGAEGAGAGTPPREGEPPRIISRILRQLGEARDQRPMTVGVVPASGFSSLCAFAGRAAEYVRQGLFRTGDLRAPPPRGPLSDAERERARRDAGAVQLAEKLLGEYRADALRVHGALARVNTLCHNAVEARHKGLMNLLLRDVIGGVGDEVDDSPAGRVTGAPQGTAGTSADAGDAGGQRAPKASPGRKPRPSLSEYFVDALSGAPQCQQPDDLDLEQRARDLHHLRLSFTSSLTGAPVVDLQPWKACSAWPDFEAAAAGRLGAPGLYCGEGGFGWAQGTALGDSSNGQGGSPQGEVRSPPYAYAPLLAPQEDVTDPYDCKQALARPRRDRLVAPPVSLSAALQGYEGVECALQGGATGRGPCFFGNDTGYVREVVRSLYDSRRDSAGLPCSVATYLRDSDAEARIHGPPGPAPSAQGVHFAPLANARVPLPREPYARTTATGRVYDYSYTARLSRPRIAAIRALPRERLEALERKLFWLHEPYFSSLGEVLELRDSARYVLRGGTPPPWAAGEEEATSEPGERAGTSEDGGDPMDDRPDPGSPLCVWDLVAPFFPNPAVAQIMLQHIRRARGGDVGSAGRFFPAPQERPWFSNLFTSGGVRGAGNLDASLSFPKESAEAMAAAARAARLAAFSLYFRELGPKVAYWPGLDERYVRFLDSECGATRDEAQSESRPAVGSAARAAVGPAPDPDNSCLPARYFPALLQQLGEAGSEARERLRQRPGQNAAGERPGIMLLRGSSLASRGLTMEGISLSSRGNSPAGRGGDPSVDARADFASRSGDGGERTASTGRTDNSRIKDSVPPTSNAPDTSEAPDGDPLGPLMEKVSTSILQPQFNSNYVSEVGQRIRAFRTFYSVSPDLYAEDSTLLGRYDQPDVKFMREPENLFVVTTVRASSAVRRGAEDLFVIGAGGRDAGKASGNPDDQARTSDPGRGGSHEPAARGGSQDSGHIPSALVTQAAAARGVTGLADTLPEEAPGTPTLPDSLTPATLSRSSSLSVPRSDAQSEEAPDQPSDAPARLPSQSDPSCPSSGKSLSFDLRASMPRGPAEAGHLTSLGMLGEPAVPGAPPSGLLGAAERIAPPWAAAGGPPGLPDPLPPLPLSSLPPGGRNSEDLIREALETARLTHRESMVRVEPIDLRSDRLASVAVVGVLRLREALNALCGWLEEIQRFLLLDLRALGSRICGRAYWADVGLRRGEFLRAGGRERRQERYLALVRRARGDGGVAPPLAGSGDADGSAGAADAGCTQGGETGPDFFEAGKEDGMRFLRLCNYILAEEIAEQSLFVVENLLAEFFHDALTQFQAELVSSIDYSKCVARGLAADLDRHQSRAGTRDGAPEAPESTGPSPDYGTVIPGPGDVSVTVQSDHIALLEFVEELMSRAFWLFRNVKGFGNSMITGVEAQDPRPGSEGAESASRGFVPREADSEGLGSDSLCFEMRTEGLSQRPRLGDRDEGRAEERGARIPVIVVPSIPGMRSSWNLCRLMFSAVRKNILNAIGSASAFSGDTGMEFLHHRVAPGGLRADNLGDAVGLRGPGFCAFMSRRFSGYSVGGFGAADRDCGARLWGSPGRDPVARGTPGGNAAGGKRGRGNARPAAFSDFSGSEGVSENGGLADRQHRTSKSPRDDTPRAADRGTGEGSRVSGPAEGRKCVAPVPRPPGSSFPGANPDISCSPAIRPRTGSSVGSAPPSGSGRSRHAATPSRGRNDSMDMEDVSDELTLLSSDSQFIFEWENSQNEVREYEGKEEASETTEETESYTERSDASGAGRESGRRGKQARPGQSSLLSLSRRPPRPGDRRRRPARRGSRADSAAAAEDPRLSGSAILAVVDSDPCLGTESNASDAGPAPLALGPLGPPDELATAGSLPTPLRRIRLPPHPRANPFQSGRAGRAGGAHSFRRIRASEGSVAIGGQRRASAAPDSSESHGDRDGSSSLRSPSKRKRSVLSLRASVELRRREGLLFSSSHSFVTGSLHSGRGSVDAAAEGVPGSFLSEEGVVPVGTSSEGASGDEE